jgi:hypothetical protein
VSAIVDLTGSDVKTASGLWTPSFTLWRNGAEVPVTGMQLKVADAPPPPPPPAARFYGDPGLSNVYIGGHEPTPQWPSTQSTLQARYDEVTRGPIAMVRRFYQDVGSYGGMASALAQDKAAGRIPWVSFKPGGTFYGRTASQLSARYDAMLAFVQVLKDADMPIFSATFHEPENDATTQYYADWGVLQEQWAAAHAEIGATKVTTTCILMSYTFRTISGRPYASWVSAGAPCQVQGIDYYAYQTNPTANQVLVSAPLDDVVARTDQSRPIAFAELGQTRSIGTTAWQEAMSDFYDLCASTERIVASCYFDSGFNSVESWPFTEAERVYYNGTLRTRSYSVTSADVLA